MAARVIFRRIRGRIIPIKNDPRVQVVGDLGAAVVASSLAATGSMKLRKKIKKKGFGGFGNFLFDSAVTGAALGIAAKKIPRVGRGLSIVFGRRFNR